MKKLCIVSTVDLPIIFFMLPHLRMLQDYYDLTVMLNTDQPDFLEEHGIKARVIPVVIRREISIFRDILALFHLTKLFRRNQFHIIHSIAPKAGLLAMLAGLFAQVPIRLHCFTGQVWVTSGGIRRLFLKLFDRLIAASATNVLADSHSQRDFLVQERIVSAAKITVLASGSVSGVDLERFRPDALIRNTVRCRWGIPHDAVICLYIGRMKRDKGVFDLARASGRLLAENPGAYMVFIGPDEEGLQQEILTCLGAFRDRVRFEGYTKTPEIVMAAADILCLPSYREGFGTVVLEAAAVGMPALASRIYGITDAVEDGITGILHAPRDIDEIASKLAVLVKDAELRKGLGIQAQQRAHLMFAQHVVVAAMLDYYRKLEADYEAHL